MSTIRRSLLVCALLAPLLPTASYLAGAAQGEDAARRQQIQQALDLVRKGTAREKAMALGFLSWALRFEAIEADPNLLSPILAATKDSDPRVREAAIASLADLPIWKPTGSPYASRPINEPRFGADHLLAATKDPSPGVRLAATRIIKDVWRREDLLLASVKDSDPWVRATAVHGLFPSASTLDALLAVLEDDRDPRFRFARGLTLRRLQGNSDPRVPPVLIRLATAEPDNRRLALSILWSIENIKAHRQAQAARLPGPQGPPGYSLGYGGAGPGTPPGQPARPTGPPSWWQRAYVPIFLGFLNDGHPSVRASAAGFLALSYDPTTIPALLDALKDPDPTVRTNVIFHLGPLAKDPRLTARVQEATSDPDPQVRQEAVRALAGLARDPMATWEASLQDPDPKVRLQGFLGLQKAATAENAPRMIALLVPLLGGPDRDVVRRNLIDLRDRTASARVRIGPKGAVRRPEDMDRADWREGRVHDRVEHPALLAALLPLLQDARPAIRADALQILQGMYDPGLPKQISPLLRDPDPQVRAAALRVLRIGPIPSLLPTVIALAKDSDPQVRMAALALLDIYREDMQARAALVDASQDPEASVRLLVLSTLASLVQHADAREALLGALNDSDGRIRAAAGAHLTQRNVPEYVDRLIAELRDPRQDARGAMQTLAKMKATRAIPDIARLLEPSHPWFKRESAAWALWEMRDPAAVESLMAAFRWTGQGSNLQEGQVKVAILNALMGFRDQRSLPLYLEASRSSDDRIRSSAAPGLGALGGTDARDRLIEMVRLDSAVLVRRSAVMAMEKLGNGAVTAALIAALKDKDSNVRYDAAKTLGQRRDRGGIDPLLDLLQAHAGEHDYVENAARVAVSQMIEPTDADRIRHRLAGETHRDTQKFLEGLLKRISDPKPGGK